jgi:hypothetical protein
LGPPSGSAALPAPAARLAGVAVAGPLVDDSGVTFGAGVVTRNGCASLLFEATGATVLVGTLSSSRGVVGVRVARAVGDVVTAVLLAARLLDNVITTV